MGFFFADNPFQCGRGDFPKGGEYQKLKGRSFKFEAAKERPQCKISSGSPKSSGKAPE
jgi:hypothetical protein